MSSSSGVSSIIGDSLSLCSGIFCTSKKSFKLNKLEKLLTMSANIRYLNSFL